MIKPIEKFRSIYCKKCEDLDVCWSTHSEYHEGGFADKWYIRNFETVRLCITTLLLLKSSPSEIVYSEIFKDRAE